MAMTKEEKREYLRRYYIANKDVIKLASKLNEAKRRENPLTRAKELQRACEKQKEYRLKNPEKYRLKAKLARLENPEKTKLKDKNSRIKHRDRRIITGREYYRNFKESLNASNREKYASDYNGMRVKNIDRGRKKVKDLTEGYIINQLTSGGFQKEDISKELIEVKRLIIKTKRL